MTERVPESRWEVVAGILLMAALAALVFGTGEVLVHGYRSAVAGRFIWSSRHIGWMAPASYLIFLLTAASPFVAFALVRPRWWLMAAAGALTSGIAVFAFVRILSAQRLHPVAIGLVAAAIAFRVARGIITAPDRWYRPARRIVPVLAALIGVWGVGSALWWAREARAEPPVAVRRGMPNVLLLVLDTVRGENLSLLGYNRTTTPHLERYAARGTNFEMALSPAPWTLPSHAAMFTGRSTWELSSGFLRKLDGAAPTLAEALTGLGYRAGGFVGNHIYASWESGLARGFQRYEDYPVSLRQVLLSSEIGQLVSSQRSRLAIRAADRPRAPEVNAGFLSWLDDGDGAPFFAFLNYMDAHLPYATPQAWERRFAGDSAMVDRYDAAVAFLDEEIGRLLDELDRRGVLDNTVLIITSDHGEHLGDHGLDDHANSLYTQLLRVPLVIAGPGVAAGRRVSSPVSLVDLPATVWQLVGDGTARFPGQSVLFEPGPDGHEDRPIVTTVERHPLGRSWFRNGSGPLWSVFSRDHHLIINPDGTVELFQFRTDPRETADLASDPSERDLVEQLKRIVDTARPTGGVAR